jgi:hypothetical protein
MKEWRSRYLEGIGIWHAAFDTLVKITGTANGSSVDCTSGVRRLGHLLDLTEAPYVTAE